MKKTTDETISAGKKSFFTGTRLEGYPDRAVFVDVRGFTDIQIAQLVNAITRDLDIKPRFSMEAALDVLREDRSKRFHEPHQLLVGFTHNALNEPVFCTRGPSEGGATIVSFDFFMQCVHQNNLPQPASDSATATTTSLLPFKKPGSPSLG